MLAPQVETKEGSPHTHVTPTELDRSEGPSLGPLGPQGPVDGIYVCLRVFGCLEWFHDIADSSGIIVGRRITQNGGMASILDNFSTNSEKSSPQCPNSFRQVDPIWSLRPNRYKENHPILVLSKSRFSSKVADLLVYTCFRELFLKKTCFILRHLRPVSL